MGNSLEHDWENYEQTMLDLFFRSLGFVFQHVEKRLGNIEETTKHVNIWQN